MNGYYSNDSYSSINSVPSVTYEKTPSGRYVQVHNDKWDGAEMVKSAVGVPVTAVGDLANKYIKEPVMDTMSGFGDAIITDGVGTILDNLDMVTNGKLPWLAKAAEQFRWAQAGRNMALESGEIKNKFLYSAGGFAAYMIPYMGQTMFYNDMASIPLNAVTGHRGLSDTVHVAGHAAGNVAEWVGTGKLMKRGKLGMLAGLAYRAGLLNGVSVTHGVDYGIDAGLRQLRQANAAAAVVAVERSHEERMDAIVRGIFARPLDKEPDAAAMSYLLHDMAAMDGYQDLMDQITREYNAASNKLRNDGEDNAIAVLKARGCTLREVKNLIALDEWFSRNSGELMERVGNVFPFEDNSTETDVMDANYPDSFGFSMGDSADVDISRHYRGKGKRDRGRGQLLERLTRENE